MQLNEIAVLGYDDSPDLLCFLEDLQIGSITKADIAEGTALDTELSLDPKARDGES